MRKGQVSVFIIIGALLLLGGALLLYNYNQSKSVPEAPQDQDANNIYTLVSSCAEQLGTEAAQLAGQQGGLIYLPNQIARDPTTHINLGSFAKLPFWYYEGQERTPSRALIQAHINRYVEENILPCIDNFSTYSERYTITAQNEPEVTTIIGDHDITITVNYPLDVTTVGKELKLERFVTQLPIPLGKLHATAVQLMQFENEKLWFENITVDFLSMDANIPMNSLEFSCRTRTWRLTEIAQELQQVLFVNLPSVRIVNTDTIPFTEEEAVYRKIMRDYKFVDILNNRVPETVPRDMYEFSRMQLDAGLKKSEVETIKVAVDYNPEWGLDINGYPSDNGKITSKTLEGPNSLLDFFCIDTIHVTYDLIYPVRISLFDEQALNGQGYIFQFAFPVIINNNRGERESFGYSQFQGFAERDDFCQLRTETETKFRAEGYYPGYGKITLPDVNFTAFCLSTQCSLGTSSAENNLYQLRTSLPQGCANPLIVAEKEGYLSQTKQYLGQDLNFDLTGLNTLNLEAETVPIFKRNDGTYTDPDLNLARPLQTGEAVTIHISYLGDEDFQQTLLYPNDKTLQLVDDDAAYSIDAILTLFDEVTGGYHSENITIRYEDLLGANTFKLRVFKIVPVEDTDEYTQNTIILLRDERLTQELGVVLE